MVRMNPGLCATCRHVKRLESPRSVFYMCLRAETDPKFRRYPPLPVLTCEGFEEAGKEDGLVKPS